jgi:hypothetical protein
MSKCHVMTYRMEVKLHVFLSLALGLGEWSALCLGHFIPRDNAHGT